MVSLAGLLPIAFAVGMALVVVGARVSRRIDRRLAMLAQLLFGRYVDDSGGERRGLLRSAHVPTTYRVYAAKTYLYSAVFAVVGGIVGVYALGGVLVILPAVGELVSQLPYTMLALLGNPEFGVTLGRRQFLGVVAVGGTVGGLVGAGGTYLLRWQLPKSRIEARRRGINESLPRTVAFLYALARGGMGFAPVVQTLARNRHVYGETADELTVAARQMDLFGMDLISAIGEASDRTPSEEFRTFSENLGSVLRSGQSLTGFLREQYDRYQQEAEERQAEILEVLATMAEAYVTVLVAGSLFLITILLVFGLTTTDTLDFIRLLGYIGIPLANLGFMVYLSQQLQLLGAAREAGARIPEGELTGLDRGPEPSSGARRADGGHVRQAARNFERLAIYDRLARFLRTVTNPARVIRRNPVVLLWITGPVALAWVVLRAPAAFRATGVTVRVLDDVLIQAALFLLGTYAAVRWIHKRRIDKVEAAVPEFLERLASLNEAGMTVVQSFDRVRGSDLGVLTEEVERIWTDVELGASVDEALVRFGRRIETTTVTRAVTLLTNAMRASGNLGPVLRIASEQARADLRMRRKRRQQMLTYLVVIYVSFLVFLVIIVAVQEVLVPSLPASVPQPVGSQNRLGVPVDQFNRFGEVNKAAYTLAFFHTALIQAVLSGFIAGQMGEGSLKEGAKHAAVLLGVAYLAFVALSSPVATVAVADQPVTDDTLVVESAELSDGGFLVVHANEADGEIIGHSAYLPQGRSTDVRIELDRSVSGDLEVVVVPHLDTNGNRRFDRGGDVDRVYPPRLDAVAETARVTSSESALERGAVGATGAVRAPEAVGAALARPAG